MTLFRCRGWMTMDPALLTRNREQHFFLKFRVPKKPRLIFTDLDNSVYGNLPHELASPPSDLFAAYRGPSGARSQADAVTDDDYDPDDASRFDPTPVLV